MTVSVENTSVETVALPVKEFISAIAGEPVRSLYRYWDGLRGSRAMPSINRIDPIDIPRPLLPMLYTMDTPGEQGHRFRLAGTALVEIFGRDVTGVCLEDVLDGDDLKNALRSYAKITASGVPWYSRVTYLDEGGAELIYERLTLPLVNPETEHVCRLLGGLFVQNDDPIHYEDFGERYRRRTLKITDRFEAVLSD